LPPPVTPSDEEPIAAGGRQISWNGNKQTTEKMTINLLPPGVLPDEEPSRCGRVAAWGGSLPPLERASRPNGRDARKVARS